MAPKPPLRVIGSGDTSGKRRSLRILVADDQRDTVTTLAAILADEGHEVHTCLRGDDALHMCRLFRPDVVIADIDLPGESGYAIARELRERHGTLAPLLIAISGKWTQASDRLLGRAVGFDHFLLKPCDTAQLLPLLERLRRSDSSSAGEAS
jgi:DNA-binding response OmpR family regulator